MQRILKFKGNHQEIGEQIGLQYKKWGKQQVRVPPFAKDYYSKQLKIYEKFFPAYLDLLIGVAKGLGLPKDKVCTSYLTGFLQVAFKKPTHNCSQVVMNNKNGVFVGSNYDWRQASESCSKLVEFSFTDKAGFGFTGISDMATWKMGEEAIKKRFLIMIEDAWNKHGLYVGLNGVMGKSNSFGMATPHLIQAIVEQCKDISEAIDLIEKVPIPEPKIFIIADKKSNFAIVEKPLEGPIKIRKGKELLLATNHYIHPELISKNAAIFKDVPFHSTFARYHYLESNLRDSYQDIDTQSLLKLLDRPPALQNWRSVENGDAVTVWTLVLNLKTGKFTVKFSPLNKEHQKLLRGSKREKWV